MNVNKFTDEFDPNRGGDDKAAEEINSAARDKVDEAEGAARKEMDDTPKDAQAMKEKMDTAPASKKRVDKKLKEKKEAEKRGTEKFEIDLDKYTEFVDRVTSDASKDINVLLNRYGELKKAGCNIERLDTAASGMSAEGGEFMEIVKKLKFQGKPYDAATKEHLQKELGDIMWYVAQAALALDTRLDEIIYINTLKLAARYPGGMFNVGYSENRAPGDI